MQPSTLARTIALALTAIWLSLRVVAYTQVLFNNENRGTGNSSKE